MTNYKEKLQKITTFMFDYDGVMTDGALILQHEGQPLRSANVKDGYVLQLAIKLRLQDCGYLWRFLQILL